MFLLKRKLKQTNAPTNLNNLYYETRCFHNMCRAVFPVKAIVGNAAIVVLGAVNLAQSGLAVIRNASADEKALATDVSVTIKSSS